jgi:hypothetical protein
MPGRLQLRHRVPHEAEQRLSVHAFFSSAGSVAIAWRNFACVAGSVPA